MVDRTPQVQPLRGGSHGIDTIELPELILRAVGSPCESVTVITPPREHSVTVLTPRVVLPCIEPSPDYRPHRLLQRALTLERKKSSFSGVQTPGSGCPTPELGPLELDIAKGPHTLNTPTSLELGSRQQSLSYAGELPARVASIIPHGLLTVGGGQAGDRYGLQHPAVERATSNSASVSLLSPSMPVVFDIRRATGTQPFAVDELASGSQRPAPRKPEDLRRLPSLLRKGPFSAQSPATDGTDLSSYKSTKRPTLQIPFLHQMDYGVGEHKKCCTPAFIPSVFHRRVEWGLRNSVATGIASCLCLFMQVTKNVKASNYFASATFIPVQTLFMTKSTLAMCLRATTYSLWGVFAALIAPYLVYYMRLFDVVGFVYARVIAGVLIFVVSFIGSYFIRVQSAAGWFIAFTPTFMIKFLPKEGPITPIDVANFSYPVKLLRDTLWASLISIVLLILPYPRTAKSELKHRLKFGTKQAAIAMRLLTEAFTIDDPVQTSLLLSRVSFVLRKLVNNISEIRLRISDVKWELAFLSREYASWKNRADALENILEGLRGMEQAAADVEFSEAHQKFADFMREPLVLLNERAQQYISIVSGEPFLDNSGSEKSLFASVSAWESTMKEPVSLMWTAYRNARYELLYTEKTGFAPIWSADEHLLSDFFMFSLQRCTDEMYGLVLIGKPKSEAGKGIMKHIERGWLPVMGESIKNALCPLKWPLERKELLRAFRFSLTITMASIFCLLPQFEHNKTRFWYPNVVTFTVGFILRAQLGGAFSFSMQRLYGTVIGGLFGLIPGYVVEHYCPHLHIEAVLVPYMMVFTFMCTYGWGSEKWGYTSIVALFTAVLVSMTNEGDLPQSGSRGEFGIARIFMTLLGTGLCILTSMCILPTRASTLANNEVVDSLRNLRKVLEAHFETYLTPLTPCLAGLKHPSVFAEVGKYSQPPGQYASKDTEGSPAVKDSEPMLGAHGMPRGSSLKRCLPKSADIRAPSKNSIILHHPVKLDIRDNVRKIRRSIKRQMTLINLAGEEPELWRQPFPATCYQAFIPVEQTLLQFVVLLGSALRDIETCDIPLQMEYLRIPFVRVKNDILKALDEIIKALTANCETFNDSELERGFVAMNISVKMVDAQFQKYAADVVREVQIHIAQRQQNADVSFEQYKQLWGVNSLVYCVRTIIRAIISMQRLVADLKYTQRDLLLTV
eukprot:226827_1